MAFQDNMLPLLDGAPGFSDAALSMAPQAEVPQPPRPAKPTRQPSYIRDHRTRLRERFMQGGADAMPDYELLELVLFRAIPRQDVKPLARRLLDEFGDLAGIVSAPPARLRQVHGIGEAVVVELKVVSAAAQRLARVRVM